MHVGNCIVIGFNSSTSVGETLIVGVIAIIVDPEFSPCKDRLNKRSVLWGVSDAPRIDSWSKNFFFVAFLGTRILQQEF